MRLSSCSACSLYVALMLAGLAGELIGRADAQARMERFRLHNAKMSELQPAMITPIMTADPRLIQYARFSIAHEYTASHAETVNLGNCRGAGVVVARRFEFDWMPPGYIQHNGAGLDGMGDTSLLAKYRLVSGSAEDGNFAVSAAVGRTFATGSHKNGALTGSYTPMVVAEKTFGRVAFVSALSGTLPTGKVAQQGRSIGWNSAAEFRAARSVWLEIEDNATFYRGGSHDGQVQNFMLPGALCVLRKKEWKAQHPYFIVDAGMQVATSGFHTYNHNLITEMRVLF